MKFTYLLIDVFTLLVPLLFSFHPRLKLYKHWKALFTAIILSAALFIPFDIYFTYLKVWGFNPDYTIGIYFFNLPVEEVLFFVCVPYSCVFTYYCLSGIFKFQPNDKVINLITLGLVGCCIILIAIFFGRYYTVFTFALMAVLLVLARFIFKIEWLPKFFVTYIILLVPFFIVNGLLTGTGLQHPIVWYNNIHTVGQRLLTIPAEDVFYGMDLILLNLLIFNALRTKADNDDETMSAVATLQVPITK